MRTPKQTIDALMNSGLTQQDIKRLTGISQALISRIRVGTTTDPRVSVVIALNRLYSDLRTTGAIR